MSEAYCHEINEHLEQYMTWKLDRVMFSRCIIGKDDKGDDVIGPDNLMDYIGKTCNKRNGRVLFERNPAWSDYQNKDFRQLLTNELVKAFFDEGVVIANRGWFSDRLGSVYKCPEAYVHVSNALPKLYEEVNAKAAQNQKQTATANSTSGMMLPLETKRKAKRKRPKLDFKK
jgi:hypothetical protein